MMKKIKKKSNLTQLVTLMTYAFEQDIDEYNKMIEDGKITFDNLNKYFMQGKKNSWKINQWRIGWFSDNKYHCQQ